MLCGFVRLFQVKMEREQYQTEIRDLQDQLSEMHDELDSAKKSVSDGERDAIMAVKRLPHYKRKEERKMFCCETFEQQLFQIAAKTCFKHKTA